MAPDLQQTKFSIETQITAALLGQIRSDLY